MLKGKTVIELTDVKTGQVERYEDENIVTNALQEYMNALCVMSGINGQLPIYKNALGGIKLFETALEENVANVLIPSVGTSKIVGYASYNTKANADARRGNINLQETSVLDNGVQLVWDFTTSEANGTIGCVCLVPKENSEDSYTPIAGTKASLGYSYILYRNVFGIDEENGLIYCHDGTRALKCKFPAENIGLCREGLFQPLEVIEVLGEWEFSTGTVTQIYNSYRLLDANTAYYIYASGTTLKEYRINLQTGEKTTSTYTVQNANFAGTYSYRFNGRTVVPQSGYKKMYSVNLEDTSDIVLIDTPDLVVTSSKYNNYYVFKLQNGDALYGNIVIDPTSGLYCPLFEAPNYGENPMMSPCVAKYKGFKILGNLPSPSYSGYSYNGDVYMAADVERLMTINNLQTPVTKTADKTMKITYTLLESESV